MALLTDYQAADFLGVSRAQIYRLRAEHKLPFVRLGKTVRYPQEALAAWLDSRVEVETSGPKREEEV